MERVISIDDIFQEIDILLFRNDYKHPNELKRDLQDIYKVRRKSNPKTVTLTGNDHLLVDNSQPTEHHETRKTKFYLGGTCKYFHYHKDTHLNLRYKSNRGCVKCQFIKDNGSLINFDNSKYERMTNEG